MGPTPRVRLPSFHEGNRMRSLRDTDATARQWLKSRTTTHNNSGTDRQMFFMLQKLARQRRRVVGGGGSAAGFMRFIGEYGGQAANAQNVFAFTPDGGAAGLYIALGNIPASTPPDTGAPNWFAVPNSPPGVWA